MNQSRTSSTRRALRIAPLSVLLVASVSIGALALRPDAPAANSALTADDSPIHDHMEVMNGAMRFFLKTGVTAENREKALEWTEKFQAAVVASKSLAPETAAKVEESKRAAFVADYRKMLVEVLASSCRLETAILDGKYEDATRVAREELGKLKKQGHDKFTEDEEEHERGRGGERK